MQGGGQVRTWREVEGVPSGLRRGFEVFSQIIDKERCFGLCATYRKGFVVDVRMRFAGSHLVRIDALLEEREKIEGGFKMADMGGTGVRNEGEGIVCSQTPCKSYPLRQGIEDVTEGVLNLFPGMGEIKILGQKGKVFIAGMKTPLIVMSSLVGPYLFTKSIDGFSGTCCQNFEFFAGSQANENIPQIKKKMGNPLDHIRS
jgi:hypothetical protein